LDNSPNGSDLFVSKRISSLDMGLQPDQIVEQYGWDVVLTYRGERPGGPLFVTDLSHVPKWTLQGRDMDAMRPLDIRMPARPREVTLVKGVLIARLSPEECQIMVFGTSPPSFTDPCYTDTTDAFAAFAVVGKECLEVLSKFSSVDLDEPDGTPLSAAQAPVEDVRCLLVSIKRDGIEPGLLVSVPRGYGPFLLEVFQDAGKEFGMAPSGWQRFTTWLKV